MKYTEEQLDLLQELIADEMERLVSATNQSNRVLTEEEVRILLDLKVDSDVTPEKHECVCSSYHLFQRGCTCGFMRKKNV